MASSKTEYEKNRRKDQLRRTLRKTKKRLDKKTHRRENGNNRQGEAWEDNMERIMPRGEQERRRAVAARIFEDWAGSDADAETITSSPDMRTSTGIVTEVHRGQCLVALADETLPCSLSGVLFADRSSDLANPVAVGDQVQIIRADAGQGVIRAILPRRSTLERPETYHGHHRQVIAANIDQVLIVASWRQPHIWLELIDRLLVSAGRNNLKAVVCINKIDLIEEPHQFSAAVQPYRELDVDLVLTSTLTGAGIDRLSMLLADRVSVLTGLSGVGKSSVLNAVEPGLGARVGLVSEGRLYRGQGRHTTTVASLHPLSDGGALVDTPGIKAFGLNGLKQPDLVWYYPDLSALASKCRFDNCRHLDEPGCTVQAAVKNGAVSNSRYQSYCKIMTELPE